MSKKHAVSAGAVSVSAAEDAVGAATVIGLTGGSGAGKSIAAGALQAHGIPVLDTDKVSRAVCAPGQPCLAALCAAFGSQILHDDGTLNRKGLAALVFGEDDPTRKAERLHTLNEITHYYILDACRIWIADAVTAHRRSGGGGRCTVCIDAPQLFESGFDRECDKILAVTAKKEVRIARIIARDFITREEAERRIAAQHDDAFFAAHSDAVIENNDAPAAVVSQVEAVLRAWGLL